MAGFRTLVIESRCKCNYSGGYLVVVTQENTVKIHLSEVSSLMFSTQQVSITAYLLSELAKAKIPVIFCDEKASPVAESLPLHGAFNCHERLEEQLAWSAPAKKQVWKRIVEDKIRGQARVLEYLGLEPARQVLLAHAENVRSGDTTNREAAAASTYFSALFGPGFSRDDNRPENAALNYGYGILLSQVNREIVALGYETSLGIFHHSALNRWNLSCDFMEPFRPYFDWLYLMDGPREFDTSVKRLLIDAMNRKVDFEDGHYNLSSVIGKYIHRCFSALSKEITAAEIPGYGF